MFGIELKHVRGQTKLNGFHFDPLGMLEKSGAIELVNIQHGPEGFYKALVKIGGQVLKPEKTFFPKHWDHFKIMENVTEALRNANTVVPKGDAYLVAGLSKDGISIEAYISKTGMVHSCYPIF